jgi:uncharacterized protein (DUF1697 family)
MQQFVAFLRAINVGGRVVKMDTLRKRFEALGYARVATFIASGNVIFGSLDADGRAHEQRIEAQLASALGYHVDTFVRTIAEVQSIAAYEPFPALGASGPVRAATGDDEGAGPWRLYVAFLKRSPAAAARERVQALRSEYDDLHVHERELYWLSRHVRSADSPVSGATIEKAIGGPATVRGMSTVQRLAAKTAGAA